MEPLLIFQGITVQQFISHLKDGLLPELKEEIMKALEEKEKDRHITTKELQTITGMSVPTINARCADGTFTKLRIGNKVYFKYSDVMKAMKSLKKYKNPLKAA